VLPGVRPFVTACRSWVKVLLLLLVYFVRASICRSVIYGYVVCIVYTIVFRPCTLLSVLSFALECISQVTEKNYCCYLCVSSVRPGVRPWYMLSLTTVNFVRANGISSVHVYHGKKCYCSYLCISSVRPFSVLLKLGYFVRASRHPSVCPCMCAR
jgi:hypothetical protein